MSDTARPSETAVVVPPYAPWGIEACMASAPFVTHTTCKLPRGHEGWHACPDGPRAATVWANGNGSGVSS